MPQCNMSETGYSALQNNTPFSGFLSEGFPTRTNATKVPLSRKKERKKVSLFSQVCVCVCVCVCGGGGRGQVAMNG